MTRELVTEGPFKGWHLFIPGRGGNPRRVGNYIRVYAKRDFKAVEEIKQKEIKQKNILKKLRVKFRFRGTKYYFVKCSCVIKGRVGHFKSKKGFICIRCEKIKWNKDAFNSL